jgi:hypothetical protein
MSNEDADTAMDQERRVLEFPSERETPRVTIALTIKNIQTDEPREYDLVVGEADRVIDIFEWLIKDYQESNANHDVISVGWSERITRYRINNRRNDYERTVETLITRRGDAVRIKRWTMVCFRFMNPMELYNFTFRSPARARVCKEIPLVSLRNLNDSQNGYSHLHWSAAFIASVGKFSTRAQQELRSLMALTDVHFVALTNYGELIYVGKSIWISLLAVILGTTAIDLIVKCVNQAYRFAPYAAVDLEISMIDNSWADDIENRISTYMSELLPVRVVVKTFDEESDHEFGPQINKTIADLYVEIEQWFARFYPGFKMISVTGDREGQNIAQLAVFSRDNGAMVSFFLRHPPEKDSSCYVWEILAFPIFTPSTLYQFVTEHLEFDSVRIERPVVLQFADEERIDEFHQMVADAISEFTPQEVVEFSDLLGRFGYIITINAARKPTVHFYDIQFIEQLSHVFSIPVRELFRRDDSRPQMIGDIMSGLAWYLMSVGRSDELEWTPHDKMLWDRYTFRSIAPAA